MSDQKPPQGQINIELDEATAEGIYSNLAGTSPPTLRAGTRVRGPRSMPDQLKRDTHHESRR